MGLGFLAMDAAEAAERGASLREVVELIREEIPLMHLYAAFDTMRYLMLGGRVNKVIGILGTTLKAKLLLIVRDGRLRPAGITRTYPRALERLLSLTEKLEALEEWSVAYTTNGEDARAVAEHVGQICSPGRVPVTRLGPALECTGAWCSAHRSQSAGCISEGASRCRL